MGKGRKTFRKYSQVFLKDVHVLNAISRSLPAGADDVVVEIGPGKGALTRYLLKKGCDVCGIEVDEKMIGILSERFANEKKLDLVHTDFLKLNMETFIRELPSHDKLWIIGNLPYDISTAIITMLAQYRMHFKLMVFMFQKEVADRMLSLPGSRQYGYLTTFVNYFFDTKKILTVAPKAFRPVPAVSSTVISLEPKATGDDPAYESSFIDFLKHCFAYKRKTIINSILSSSGMSFERQELAEILQGFNLSETARAEELDLSTIKNLHDTIYKRS